MAKEENQPLLGHESSQKASHLAHTNSIGYYYITLSAIFQTCLVIFSRISIKRGITIGTLLLLRGITCVTTLTILFLYQTTTTIEFDITYTRIDVLRLCVRAFTTSFSLFFLFHSLKGLPSGVSLSLFNTTPAWTILIVAVLTRSKLTRPNILTLALKSIGAFLIITSYTFKPVSQALLAAILSSFTFTLLASRPAHFPAPLCMFGVGIATLLIASWDRSTNLRQTPTLTVLIGFFGSLSGVLSQLFLVKGMPLIPTAPGVVIRSLAVPFTYVGAFITLGEVISLQSTVGVIFILLGVVIVAYNIDINNNCLN